MPVPIVLGIRDCTETGWSLVAVSTVAIDYHRHEFIIITDVHIKALGHYIGQTCSCSLVHDAAAPMIRHTEKVGSKIMIENSRPASNVTNVHIIN